jgi:hypothetical protein
MCIISLASSLAALSHPSAAPPINKLRRSTVQPSTCISPMADVQCSALAYFHFTQRGSSITYVHLAHN